MPIRFARLFTSRRVAPLFLLGMASGLPLELTSNTLQVWLTVAGVSLQEIGLLTLAGAAYTLKFLWSPLVDRYAPPGLGRRRGWIFLTQWLLALALVGMGLLSPRESLGTLALLAVMVAFFSATQDIAFDAYRADLLQPYERGAGVALSVLGYRLAKVVSGGLAVVAAEKWLGWNNVYILMGVCMAALSAVTLFAVEPQRDVQAPVSLRAAVMEPFREFFGRNGAWEMVLFIIIYKLGDAFASALSNTFLIRHGQFNAETVGWVNNVLGIAATVVGAVLGGALLARLRLFRALLLFGALQGASNLGYALIAWYPGELALMVPVVAFENVCSGLGTAAFVALLLAVCDARYSATQFALLSALAAIGRTYIAGPLTPPLVGWLGWPGFFLLSVAVAVPGLWLLWRRKTEIEHLDTRQDPESGDPS
ncbi:AmpG family muropeptide MFS transporter [Kerstersia gyiorum]|uniref:Muropeptide transporter n=2 Tax=Kerstersia gyiorum TaxID=206506 RepID=A0A171KWF4_9BURK|nr:muropeptide transporter [Kerstersia gyiorum]